MYNLAFTRKLQKLYQRHQVVPSHIDLLERSRSYDQRIESVQRPPYNLATLKPL